MAGPHMSVPLVTIILPVYNVERFVAETIESIITQSFEDWELLIVDDGATDRTSAIIANYQSGDGRIRVVSHATNSGPHAARNTALGLARGALIAFLDGDDVWYHEKLAKQVAAMERSRADISYTGYERRRDGRRRGTIVEVPRQVSYRTMLGRNKIALCTAMVRRSTCGAHRMPRGRPGGDHRYWLALLRDGSRTAVGVTEPLARYRVRRNSVSANKLIEARYFWMRLREDERLGRWRSLRYFISYAFGSLKIRARFPVITVLFGKRQTITCQRQERSPEPGSERGRGMV